MQKKIEEYILGQLKSFSKKKRFDSLTIGVEQEFFLFDFTGQAASLEQSQEFLFCLSKESDWNTRETNIKSGTTYITRVSRELPDKRYTVVKYEFPSHMLEVAFSYFSNLIELYEEISLTWETLNRCSQKVDLKIVSVPIIDQVNISEDDQNCIDEKFLDLHRSREFYYHHRGEVVNYENLDFPSRIAATQIQIGGSYWWQDSNLVNSLYLVEPIIQPFSFRLATQSEDEALSLFRRRWSSYEDVFRGIPLCGFPDLEMWNIDSWIKALMRSPVFDEVGKVIDQKDLEQYHSQKLFSSFRDLQIIRPKIIGTLEFRADPAQRGPEEIIVLAAVRLAQVLWGKSIIENSQLPYGGQFRSARKAWRAALSEDFASPQLFFNWLILSYELLKQRGKNEQLYLEGLIEKKAA